MNPLTLSLNKSASMRLAVGAALLASASMLGGCVFDPEDERYVRRSDFITLGAGNAVAHNKAVQTINPWPSWSSNDRINMDGDKAYLAIRRYKEDKVKPPATTKLEPFSGSSIFVGGNGATP
jgi:hypothetical protein